MQAFKFCLFFVSSLRGFCESSQIFLNADNVCAGFIDEEQEQV